MLKNTLIVDLYRSLKGNYELAKNGLIPHAEATIIMYAEKELRPEEHFFTDNDFTLGAELVMGKSKAKIISMKKGELILKIE